MAKAKSNGKAKGNGKSAGRRRQARADDGSGMGHNLNQIRKGIKGFSARYNAILDRKETLDGEAMSDCRTLVQEAANNLGCKRSSVRQALKEQRADKKRLEKEKEMEPGELQELDSLRAALGLFVDTPLGQAAANAAADEPGEADNLATG